EDAQFAHGIRRTRAARLKATLWNLPALATMHRNWCIPENRPIQLRGTWRGESFRIKDLCDEGWQAQIPGATGAWLGYQRFQKNLSRECPTACVH
ncbi:MAG: hypothetical protein ACI9U2_004282, partial [Bradymonadia bacterium]